jgi:hypothetical protein
MGPVKQATCTTKMDIATLYSARNLPRPSLSEEIANIIAKLKISFKPSYPRRPRQPRRQEADEQGDWRADALRDVVRKVREKDDPDYDEINSYINKLTKQTYTKMISEILLRIQKRDPMFRLRVTTLLFDRGIRQNFFAAIMADAYSDIIKVFPDASADLLTQVAKFDELYDTNKLVVVPGSDDAGYDEAIIAWTKLKETKRGFAVYVSELFARGLIPDDIMNTLMTHVFTDMRESLGAPKTAMKEEHVDALVRFVFAMASKMPDIKNAIRAILAVPKADAPCLNMKSRFKLEDALKV